MASRIWTDIPANHEFRLKLQIVDGTKQFSAFCIYDPLGPALDPPRSLDELLAGFSRPISDGNATATFDARYVRPDTTVIDVTASVNSIANGTAHPDTDGDVEYRQRFTGNGPGGRTELPFYLFLA